MGDGKIFISYRRDDSAGYARAISDQLAQRFSKERIFMDVDSIEPGLPFDQVIENAVGRCDVLLAMIGRRWLKPLDGGAPRLNDPRDFVRIEIAAALARNIRVIPVLLEGATMPAADALPEPLRPLASRNAIEVSNTRFGSDVARLGDTVGKVLGPTSTPGKSGIAFPRAVGPATLMYRRPDAFAALSIDTGIGAHWAARELQPQICLQGNLDPMMLVAGGHVAQGFNFVLAHDAVGPGQSDWRYCQKCQSLFFDGTPLKGVCPAGDGHAAAGYNFVLPYA